MSYPYPFVSPVHWARGRYDSYTLYPDGALVGTIHPPGLAYELKGNQDLLPPTDNLVFLSSRNQKCSGGGFICASLPRAFKYMTSKPNFPCELILLMGVRSNTSTLHNPDIKLYYYSLRKDLSRRAIMDAFDECPNSTSFISRIFDLSIQVAPHNKMHIRYLNQIYGPSYPTWKVLPSLVTVGGKRYHQCRPGPDQWLVRTKFFCEREIVDLTKPQMSHWQNRTDFFCKDYVLDSEDLRKITGTKNVAQFKGGKVLVTYTTKQRAYGGFLWMPLPLSPQNMQDFALITMKQKMLVDNYFFDEPNCTIPLMDPKHFRKWMIKLAQENGIDSFVRLTNLRCNGNYFDNKCVMFVVSIVSEMELEGLAQSKMNCNSHQQFTVMEHNQQDPYYVGTVVFRGSPFPKRCQIGMNEVSLIMESYPKSLMRYRTKNQGTFYMIGKRQSSMSSRSMGIGSDRTEHDYFNECDMNTSLVPMTSALMSCLRRCSAQVQEVSGQVLIGLIKTAFSRHYHWEDITSEHICPYGIMTCPRRIRGNQVVESFCNSGHRDSSDCIDDEQGVIVHDYAKTQNSPVLNDYLERMYAMFDDRLRHPRVPLPTTCAWKMLEQPELFGYKHMSYFVVSEAGISWDLSSHVYNDVSEIMGATFLSGLVEHATSCSLWIEETTGCVTTLCPGNASNFAWGGSGRKTGLRNATRNKVVAGI